MTSAEAGFDGVRERVLESTPVFLRRNIRGRSPSEHFFHLFLAFLHDAGILDQPTPPPDGGAVALRNSLTFVDRLLVRSGSPSSKIALVATNGRCFVATGCAYPMRYLHVEGISDCPVCQARNDRSEQRGGRRISHEALRAVVVEANRDVASRPGWRDVPDRSALIVGAGPGTRDLASTLTASSRRRRLPRRRRPARRRRGGLDAAGSR